MSELIEINPNRRFNLDQVNHVLPVVARLTTKAEEQIAKLNSQLAFQVNDERRRELEFEIQKIFDCWYSKVTKLGGVPKGMWLVDFDSGEGYYCWNFPEETIDHYHGYTEGYRGRVRI